MIPLTTLWLPILLSTIFVFIASNILHMAIPAWHRADYGKLPDEKPVLDALRAAASGQYITPHVNWNKLPKDEREEMMKGPMAFLLVRNPMLFSFPKSLISYFVYTLIVSVLIAYVGAVTLRPGTIGVEVFRVLGTAGILAYAFQSINDSIWYGKPWSATTKDTIDGVIYGLVTAATFAWLWPR
jgi:hypothetical protein